MYKSAIAVVLAAGASRRLYPLTKDRPKCLLEIGEQTIIDYQMDALCGIGIQEVCLVLGYRREQIMSHLQHRYPAITFRYVINHRFFETNTAISLWMAGKQFLDREMILLNGDVLFDARVLERVMAARHTASLAVVSKQCGEEEVKVVVDENNRILRISKELSPADCLGEYIGVARFSAEFTRLFFDSLNQLAHTDKGKNAFYEHALDSLMAEQAAHTLDVTELPCIEIDFLEDYIVACNQVFPRIGAEEAGYDDLTDTSGK